MAMAAVLNSPARPDYLRAPAAGRHRDRQHASGIRVEPGNRRHRDALRLASSLFPMWQDRGRNGEGLAWLAAALGPETANLTCRPRSACTRDCDRVILVAWTVRLASADESETAIALARQTGDPIVLIRALIARGISTYYDEELAARALPKRPNLRRGWMTHGSGVRSMSRRRAPRSGQAIQAPPSKRPRRHSRWPTEIGHHAAIAGVSLGPRLDSGMARRPDAVPWSKLDRRSRKLQRHMTRCCSCTRFGAGIRKGRTWVTATVHEHPPMRHLPPRLI